MASNVGRGGQHGVVSDAFLLQHTESRDTRAINLKLDELLRAIDWARETGFAGLHTKDYAELDEIESRLAREISDEPGDLPSERTGSRSDQTLPLPMPQSRRIE